jgi:hypothetical protein
MPAGKLARLFRQGFSPKKRDDAEGGHLREMPCPDARFASVLCLLQREAGLDDNLVLKRGAFFCATTNLDNFKPA